MTTDRDYADMVNPYVRAEQEAHARGYREGLASGIFYALVAIAGLGMLLVALNAHAEIAEELDAWKPIKASDVHARLTVCHEHREPLGAPWRCFAVR